MNDLFAARRRYSTLGTGLDWRGKLLALGEGAVIEDGVRIFHPENVRIGAGVYVGHGAHLDGYHKGMIVVGEGSWIGALAFVHGAGGVEIGRDVGIGPRVSILTSAHTAEDSDVPVLHTPLEFGAVAVGDGADIGVGAVLLPGVSVGEGAIVGAGAVVSSDVSPRTVVAGVPARVLRTR